MYRSVEYQKYWRDSPPQRAITSYSVDPNPHLMPSAAGGDSLLTAWGINIALCSRGALTVRACICTCSVMSCGCAGRWPARSEIRTRGASTPSADRTARSGRSGRSTFFAGLLLSTAARDKSVFWRNRRRGVGLEGSTLHRARSGVEGSPPVLDREEGVHCGLFGSAFLRFGVRGGLLGSALGLRGTIN